MTEKDIQGRLDILFANYEYHLKNSFVFNWECDYFCQSPSGYFVETEVKVSRSDFLKDFEKDKHKIFTDLVKGKQISVYKNDYGGRYHGDVIIKNFQEIEIKCHGHRSLNIGGPNHIKNGSESLIELNYETRRTRFNDDIEKTKMKRFIVNDWQDRLEIVKPSWKCRDVHAPVTNIGYHKLSEINIPNQIYYAVPKGLIKLSELPPYAGLIEISHYAELTKKAPYMHKRKMDLDRILLKKFYNLWKYKGKWVDDNAA